jgi:hypothetical protein
VKFNFLHRQAHAGIDLTEDGREQWRAGYYFSGGASELSTNMRPYNVTLDKRGPKARAERRRCEVFLEGSGGMPPGKFLNLESLKCHFLDFGRRFDRNLMVRKRDYNVSKFAIWLEFCSST